MRLLLHLFGGLAALLALGLGALWLFGPRVPADLRAEFDPRRFGEGVQVHFETVESAHDDITPGVRKRVIWQEGFRERRTPVSLLYVHGFSATSEEIRPVPDRLAAALGANLVYTRLAGHGRGSEALAGPTVADWMRDMAEGLAAARAVGERVVVLSTSTGGTLAAAAALDPVMSRDVAAMIFVSPNFGINDPAAPLLTWPGAAWWLPRIAGERRSFTPANPMQARYWTTEYPVTALLPMAALVREVRALPFGEARIPALFRFSPGDRVVRADRTREIAARWGGPVLVQEVTAGGPGMDPSAHVIAGDILSPAGTEPAVAAMLDWLRGLGL